tara:strand:+ start:842 stop:1216 length:375 start_codon:yes stop_codon:yes gene_type:complete
MGNKNTKIDENQVFNLSIQEPSNISVKSFNIKNSNNIKYVYFLIKGIKPINLIQKDIKIYISSIYIENNIFEDKINNMVPNNIKINNINNKKWNDIYLYSEKGNKLIIRFDNITSSNITLIYEI